MANNDFDFDGNKIDDLTENEIEEMENDLVLEQQELEDFAQDGYWENEGMMDMYDTGDPYDCEYDGGWEE